MTDPMPLTRGLLWRALAAVVPVAVIVTSHAAIAQSGDPKSEFVQAVGQFGVALDGASGDEGGRIRSSLNAMQSALTRWDTTIRTYEAAMASELRNADPKLATRLHLAIAGVYLDRGRSSDALRELAAAHQLDPERADAVTFEALTRSQLTGEDAAAASAFRRAAALNADDAVTAYLLGRQLSRVGAAEDANQALSRFRAIEASRVTPARDAAPAPFPRLGLIQETAGVSPFFPPAFYVDGFTALKQARYPDALEAFQRAVESDPLTRDAGVEAGALARAAAAFRDGSSETAIEHVGVAIELAPDRAEPRRILGLLHLADHRVDDAIDALKTAVRLSPRDERARLALSNAYVESGQMMDARQTLQDTLALFPASGRARYQLGLVYQRQGLYADAVRELTTAANQKPLLGLNSIYQTLGALARAQQDYDAAIAAFSQRVDLVPNSSDAHQELGAMYFRQGRHVEALAEFTAALMINPKRTESYVAIGQVHLRDGHYEDAAAACRHAVSLDGSDKEARYVLATSLIRLGKDDEGKQHLAVYQRLQAEETSARSRQLEIEGLRRDAAVSLASGEYEKAIDLLRRALERDPESAVSHMDLGIALLKAGHASEAVAQFTAAVARNAGEDAHAYLADAFAAMGRSDDSQRERAIYQRMRQESLRRAGASR